ncbi:MAG: hypothetical protein JEY94_15850 [Melioribacteraceae bacterium]|nr:hypothetical protein [Melioribacteraceae bacterium]
MSANIFNDIIKPYLLLFFSFFIIGLCSCDEDSALSDLEFDDPSVIKPTVTILKEVNGNNINQEVEVYLYDKNHDQIQLKNGDVYLNGEEMILKDNWLTDAKYYSGIEIIKNISYPKNYYFEVEFYNGDNYDISIRTQPNEFTELNVASRYPKNENILISWNKFDVYYAISADITVYYIENDNVETSSLNINFPEYSAKNGSYELSKSYFNFDDSIYKIDIKLSTVAEGLVDQNFMNGAFAKSINSISASVELY